jgi:2-keto-4-pentenoate hydratase/2-oxohepta-3-ene-1,7-dioic acid hydratase in catechol pathway
MPPMRRVVLSSQMPKQGVDGLTVRYRFARVHVDGVDVLMVEHGNRLLPLREILEDRDLERCPNAVWSDLMPLLQEWDYWREVLPVRVASSTEAFNLRGNGEPGAFLPPVALPRKLICIGSNYYDHIREMPIPAEPTYPYAFLKPPSTTLRGSGEPVCVPQKVQMMDWEAELAIVIGAVCRNVSVAQALDVVAGYSAINDLSARDWVASRPPIGMDWILHKGFDGFAPMGPYFVPAASVPEPQKLPITLTVNGDVKQRSNTDQMVFGVREIIAHLSSVMTLEPGDVIATGTPAGTGMGRKPPQYLQPGDMVRIRIGEFGELMTPIVGS